jgi:hypothetical protein
MDILVSIDGIVPPSGRVQAAGAAPVDFTGRLGLLQAIDAILTESSPDAPVASALEGLPGE